MAVRSRYFKSNQRANLFQEQRGIPNEACRQRYLSPEEPWSTRWSERTCKQASPFRNLYAFQGRYPSQVHRYQKSCEQAPHQRSQAVEEGCQGECPNRGRAASHSQLQTGIPTPAETMSTFYHRIIQLVNDRFMPFKPTWRRHSTPECLITRCVRPRDG